MKFNIDKDRLGIALILVFIVFWLSGIPSMFTVYGVENNIKGFEHSRGVHDSIGPVFLTWWAMNIFLAMAVYVLVQLKMIFFKK